MIAERHADSARQRLVAVARNEAGQIAVHRRGEIAHRLATVVGRLRAAVAARSHPSPTIEKPGTVVG
jgi:hypothetical protein